MIPHPRDVKVKEAALDMARYVEGVVACYELTPAEFNGILLDHMSFFNIHAVRTERRASSGAPEREAPSTPGTREAPPENAAAASGWRMTAKEEARLVARHVVENTHFTTVIEHALDRARAAGQKEALERVRRFLERYRVEGDRSVVVRMVLDELDRWGAE